MSTNETAGVEVDLAAIEATLEKMSPDQLAAEVLKIRTQQKFQAKKNQGSAGHKAYQKKQQEKKRLMIAKAKELGLYDKVNEQAEAAANAKFEEFLNTETIPETEETTA